MLLMGIQAEAKAVVIRASQIYMGVMPGGTCERVLVLFDPEEELPLPVQVISSSRL